jgi:hypothetical protein
VVWACTHVDTLRRRGTCVHFCAIVFTFVQLGRGNLSVNWIGFSCVGSACEWDDLKTAWGVS